MSEKSTLSLSSKLSPEIQNKLQQLAGKPDTTKSELPNTAEYIIAFTIDNSKKIKFFKKYCVVLST